VGLEIIVGQIPAMVIGFEPFIKMNLIKVGRHDFFAQFVSFGADKRHAESCEHGDVGLQNPIWIHIGMSIRRLDLAELSGDDQQPVRVGTHSSNPIDEHGTLHGERMDKIAEVLPLDHASAFQAGEAVVSESQGFLLDPGEPSREARKIEGILLTLIHQHDAAWRLELRTPRSAKTGTSAGETGAAVICHASGEVISGRRLIGLGMPSILTVAA
jgi:hypothetical protein